MKNKFIQMAINMQDECDTIGEAIRRFSDSCRICNIRGIKMDCDKCPIKNHHELTMAAIEDSREYDLLKLARQQAAATSEVFAGGNDDDQRHTH